MGTQRPCRRSAKNRLKTAINPSSRHKHRNKIAVSARLDPGRAQNGHVNNLVQETATTAGPSAVSCTVTTRTLSAQQQPCQQPCPGTGHHNRDIDHLVNVLQLRELHSFLHSLDHAGTSNSRTALVGSQRSSPQFALWIHATITNRRLKHSVDELDLRHHPHVQRGLLELNLHGYRDVQNRRNRPTTKRCSLSPAKPPPPPRPPPPSHCLPPNAAS